MEILVNATPEECRVVLLEGGKPVEILVERPAEDGVVGNVYLGRVDKILPGMQSAFVDIGLERHAFLHVTDATPETFQPESAAEGAGTLEDAAALRRKAALDQRIEDLISPNEAIVVQVTREPAGGKGARLTRHVSLAGSYLVYLPFATQVSISKRIDDEPAREALRATIERLRGNAGGFIARTAAAGQDEGVLRQDLETLVSSWKELKERAARDKPPARLRAEPALPVRLVRDALGSGLERVVVDDEARHAELVAFLERHAPELVARVQRYEGPVPLFESLGMEQEIEKALRDRTWLKSGGYIVINQLEALVAIDVNTGKYTGTRRLEETVLQTNLEAAREVARQLRLRDLGGIIVIDFIDMMEAGHRQQVLRELETALARDRAKTTVLGMSEFGLVELTRQRQRKSLHLTLTEPCADCAGSGRVRSVKTTVNAILRRLRGLELGKEGREVTVRVHPDMAERLREALEAAMGSREPLGVKVRITEEPGRHRATFDLSS